MCTPWDPGSCATELAVAATTGVFDVLAKSVVDAIKWIITSTVSWWTLVPSVPLCDTKDGVTATLDQCHSPAATLRSWILPITAIIALGGILWNALLMILSRRPQPLFTVVKGLFTTAVWSAVGIIGTDLLLKGTDTFSIFILSQVVHDLDAGKLADRMTMLLVPSATLGITAPLMFIIGLVIVVATFTQALLMLFRDGSIIILAGLLPLAASGTFTTATSGWLRKLMAWMLALICYKPMAALVYAVAFLMMGDSQSQDIRMFFFGVAMLILSLVALPVLMKFFNWTVGSLQPGGGGLGMLAGAGAAGLHAGATLRGVGGRGVNDHARYLDSNLGGNGPSSPSGGTTPPTPGPGPGGPGPTPGGPPAAPKPPAFIGDVGVGKVATVTSAGTHGGATTNASTAGTATGASIAGTATASTGAASGGAASAGTAAAGSSAATGAATGAAAATGPAAPIVMGVVVGVQAAAGAAKAGANAAASAADGASE